MTNSLGDGEVSPSGPASGDEAIAVETYVTAESGQWVVELVVVMADSVVRSRINTYRTEREATLAASWIKRGASRNIDGPSNG